LTNSPGNAGDPVSQGLISTDVIDTLADLFILSSILANIRSDNGPEFIAIALRKWSADVGAQTAYIGPSSPLENGYCESFNSKLRNKMLKGEIFYSLKQAKVVIEGWVTPYNTLRPHSSLSYKPQRPVPHYGRPRDCDQPRRL